MDLPTSPDHVPEAERVAVFDNDGTPWPERTLPLQAAFALDRLVEALGAAHARGWTVVDMTRDRETVFTPAASRR